MNINGFAVNIELIIKSDNPSFPNESDYEVSEFVKNLIANKDELEPKADMCSKVDISIRIFLNIFRIFSFFYIHNKLIGINF